MKKYERPVIVVNEELAEGVYAASGVNCYTVSGYGCQDGYEVPGRSDLNAWTVQMNASHAATDQHHSGYREITLTFNYPVTVFSHEDNTTVIGSGTGSIIKVALNHHNNATENIGLGAFVVTVATGVTDLEVTGVEIGNCSLECYESGH